MPVRDAIEAHGALDRARDLHHEDHAGALIEAIREYQRATTLGPSFADLRYRLARLFLEVGRTLEARDELERVVRERPQFVDAQAALGLARYLSGDAAGAEEIWNECLNIRPENPRVEAYLAMMERGTA
jgi:tetratricopeptide (TPR) repeat protein